MSAALCRLSACPHRGRAHHRNAREKLGVLSFLIDDYSSARHRHDSRSGRHSGGARAIIAAQPLMRRLNVPATARASFASTILGRGGRSGAHGEKVIESSIALRRRGLLTAIRYVRTQRAFTGGHPRSQQEASNFHKLETANHTAEGYNPLCGDQLTFFGSSEADAVKD